MILAARKIDIEQDDRGHDSDHSDGMISCEDLAEHRDAYDGRHDRLRKGKHSSLTGFHMGSCRWCTGGMEPGWKRVPAAENEVLQRRWRTPQQRFRQYDRTEAAREMRSQMCRRSRSARCIFLRQRVRKCCKDHSPDQIRDQKGSPARR